MKAFKRSLALILAILMLIPGFSFSAMGAEPDFKVSVAADKADYNAGDTVTAIISVSPSGKTINSYQFKLEYDAAKLELVDVVTMLSVESISASNNGTYGFVITGDGVQISGEKLAVAKATFKVKDSVASCDSTSIALSACYVGQQGVVTDPVTEFEGAVSIGLHKHVITLVAGEGGTINGGDSLTLYAKFGEAGLYSDAGFTTPAENVIAAAKSGYVLDSDNWTDGDVDYRDFAALKAKVFAGSATITLQTTKMPVLTVSASGVTGGTLAKEGTLPVAPGAALTHDMLVNAGFVPTASTGYTFTGWAVGSQTLGLSGSVTVNADETIKPIFTANQYGFTAPTASEAYTATITGGVANGKATHGQDITMTVTPAENHAIASVSYTVNGVASTINPVNGVYTIPGADILGDISVVIETVEYRTVTFSAGTGAQLAQVKLYAKYNNAGLYTDPACTTIAAVPAPTAQTGYRLPADNAAEPMWKDANGKTYTSEAAAKTIVTADLSLTVSGIKQVSVIFVAGENGKLGGNTSLTVDAGTSFGSIPKPETIADAGYVFKNWAPAVDKVDADTTFTAQFERGTYTVSIPASSLYTVSVTPAEGITDNGDGTYSVVYGTDVTFSVSGVNGSKITGVQYKVGSDSAVSLGTAAGSYTVPGSAITAGVSIIITVDNTSKITFAAGANGSFSGTASVVKSFENGYVITEGDVPTPTANVGYEFIGWDVAPVGKTVSGDATYTAQYRDASYEVKVDGEPRGEATYGEDYKLPAYTDGTVITEIKVTIRGQEVTATKDADGNYVISGADITGPVDIITTTSPITIKFIYQRQYQAIADGMKMAVLETAKLSGSRYVLSDGVEFFWSGKYNAYVRFVTEAMTEAQLAAQITTADGDATEIIYDGDISGNGIVTVVDGGIINDTISGKIDQSQLSDMMRFKMDVSNAPTTDNVTTINGQNVQVTTNDIQTVVNMAVGA